jgi:hypothetical protein
MNETFTCTDCGALVFDATAYRVQGQRTRCFLCDWVRAEEPDDEGRRDELRRLVNRE